MVQAAHSALPVMVNPRRPIAILCPAGDGAGSVAAVAIRQAEGLAKRFAVSLVSDSLPAGLPGDVRGVIIRPPDFVWLRRFGHVPREVAFAMAAYRALTGSTRPQFVLCHGHTVAALAGARLQARHAVPFGLVTHGDIFDRPRGTYDPLLTWLYRRVTPTAYRCADLIVALSPHMQQLAARGGAPADRIRLIPNGIDGIDSGVSNHQEVPALTSGEPIRILFVGRLSIEKGVDTLLRACARLARRNLPFKLRLAGDGPLRGELEYSASSLGIGPQTHFLGAVPRNQLGTEYAACHLVCVPSRSDPLPTVVLESLAAGRPVIGSRVGGIPFMVPEGQSGLLVSPDADEELAAALERAIGNPGMLAEMGRHAYHDARERFSWDRATQQLAAAIGDTIDRRKPGTRLDEPAVG